MEYPLKKLMLCLVILSALVLNPTAKADSITLQSHTGSTWNYELTLDNYFTNFTLSGFQLSGLQGVTNAVLSSDLANQFGVFFDSNTVTVGTIFANGTKVKDTYSGIATVVENGKVALDTNFTLVLLEKL